MQDRYAGDIGDFGKFGLLKALEQTGLSVGINWYWTEPKRKEIWQEDGKYRIAQKYFSCDESLARALFEISCSASNRSVEALEQASLLKTGLYFRQWVGNKEERLSWHQQALSVLQNCEFVFLDPDNGLLVKSVSPRSIKASKYVFDDELQDYLKRGQAVIFYQHRQRKPASVYFDQMISRIRLLCDDAKILALTFPKCTVRDYFIVCPGGQFYSQVICAVDEMLEGPWASLGIVKRTS